MIYKATHDRRSRGRFVKLLDAINVRCEDDGARFRDRFRADQIDTAIGRIAPAWIRSYDGALALLYRASRSYKPGGLLISAHIDSHYKRCHHRLRAGFWEGTFDNSFPVCLLIDALRSPRFLTEGVTLALTGDEKCKCRGAAEAVEALDQQGARPAFVLVLDVTAEDDGGVGATIENWFPGNSGPFGPDDRIMGRRLSKLAGVWRVIDDADPDEVSRYRELGLPCASLCLPSGPLPGDEREVATWMHDDVGFAVRAEAPSRYQAALLRLVRGIATAVK